MSDSLPDQILITGASGTGTTSLGSVIATRLGHHHLDTDSFFWQPTDPPYQTPRPVDARLSALQREIRNLSRWVLSGSLDGWGDPLIPQFQLVIWLNVPTPVRLDRLRRRESEQFGSRIEAGGDMEEGHRAFMNWSAAYDSGGMDMRSRTRHLVWLDALSCPVIRIQAEGTIEAIFEEALRRWSEGYLRPAD